MDGLWERARARLVLFASDIRLIVLLFSSGVYDACRFWPKAISDFRQVQWKHRMLLFAVNFGALGIVWAISQLIDLGLSYFSSSYVTALRYFVYLLSLVWLIPTWIAAIVINFWLNSKVVSAAASRVRVIGGPARPSQSRPEVAFFAELVGEIQGMLGEILTVSLVNLTMTIISALTPLIPVFGKAISFVQTAMIYGHTCFETRLGMQKLTPKERILFVDRHWLYFLGFGTPLTALTFFLPFFLSTGLYSSLLPLYAIMSLYASPVRAPLGRTRIPERISYASEAFWIVGWLKARYYEYQNRAAPTTPPVEAAKADMLSQSPLPPASPLQDPNPAASSSSPVSSRRSGIALPSLIHRKPSITPFSANSAVPEVGVIHQAPSLSVSLPDTASLLPAVVRQVPLLQPELWGSLADGSLSSLSLPVPTLPAPGDGEPKTPASDATVPNTDGPVGQQEHSVEARVVPIVAADPVPVQVITAFPNTGPITVLGSEQPLPLLVQVPLTAPPPPARKLASAMNQMNG